MVWSFDKIKGYDYDSYEAGVNNCSDTWGSCVKKLQEKYNNPAIQEVLKQLLDMTRAL